MLELARADNRFVTAFPGNGGAMKNLLMLALLAMMTSGAATALAQGVHSQNPPPNMMKMEGASPVCDGQVSYDNNFFQAARAADGTYTITMYFNPDGVETLVPELNEQLRMRQFPYATIRVWLGNLSDKKQRVKMPEGVVDLPNKRVTFTGVKLSGIERMNLPVKFYDDAGKEIKIPNDTGGPLGKGYAWGWIPSHQVSTPASVEGTPHNGWRVEVMPDGTLEPRGLKVLTLP